METGPLWGRTGVNRQVSPINPGKQESSLLYHRLVFYKGHNTHFFSALRAHQWVGAPDFLNSLRPSSFREKWLRMGIDRCAKSFSLEWSCRHQLQQEHIDIRRWLNGTRRHSTAQKRRALEARLTSTGRKSVEAENCSNALKSSVRLSYPIKYRQEQSYTA